MTSDGDALTQTEQIVNAAAGRMRFRDEAGDVVGRMRALRRRVETDDCEISDADREFYSAWIDDELAALDALLTGPPAG